MEAGSKEQMHVITRKRLADFWSIHPDAEAPLRSWLKMMQHKRYSNSNELKRDFVTASFLKEGCTVFNIGGNKFRLVVTMRYDMGKVFVYRMLTHGEYDDHVAHATLCPERH
jgi:mRNA interferase HigB